MARTEGAGRRTNPPEKDLAIPCIRISSQITLALAVMHVITALCAADEQMAITQLKATSTSLTAVGGGWIILVAASEHYTVRVRLARDGGEWQSAFAWETVCKTIQKGTDGYFDTLAGWTHTYVNCETNGAVEVEIDRVNGQPIRSAVVHPQRKASACSVKDGKASRIRNLTFENLTVAGELVHNAEFFKTNEFVDGLRFLPSGASQP